MEFPKNISPSEKEKLQAAVVFVKQSLIDAEAGHDWLHIERVWNNAMQLLEEDPNCDVFLIGLGVLFHDIADPKFHQGDTEIGPKITQEFLERIDSPKATIQKVLDIVRFSSFSASNKGLTQPDFIEFKIVQDADRLDALGAIGIARTFNYGGYKNNPLYLPNLNKEEVDNSSLQHFHDKLFKLKDLMNTSRAKDIAQRRHEYMLEFTKQFLAEWNAEA